MAATQRGGQRGFGLLKDLVGRCGLQFIPFQICSGYYPPRHSSSIKYTVMTYANEDKRQKNETSRPAIE